jgi:site-specific DNA-methyltransferase (adenine-specific)
MTWTVTKGDCLKAMRSIPDNSIDACITDPPYGTTACKWDSVIPFEPMWEQLKRIVKPNGAIVLFASQPFTSALVMSNVKMFRYEWIWQKEQGVNFQLVKSQPLKIHESICIFANERPNYNPQGLKPCRIVKSNKGKGGRLNHIVGVEQKRDFYIQSFSNYPVSVQRFNRQVGFHPTQKPVDLLRYLVRTYTNEGDTVLDFTCGSGTTGVACVIEGRNFIGIEREASYFKIAKQRIAEASRMEVAA